MFTDQHTIISILNIHKTLKCIFYDVLSHITAHTRPASRPPPFSFHFSSFLFCIIVIFRLTLSLRALRCLTSFCYGYCCQLNIAASAFSPSLPSLRSTASPSPQPAYLLFLRPLAKAGTPPSRGRALSLGVSCWK